MSSSKGRSRWADSEEDAAREAAFKKEKELKKRLKKEKEAARKAEEAARQRKLSQHDAATAVDAVEGRPAKRRRVTPEPGVARSSRDEASSSSSSKLLRLQGGGFGKARSVENYDKLNDIEEGAYGWVARAKELATGRVVALKRLKIEPNDRNGLPVTGLREIQILKDCEHRNIVKLQEVVVGDDTSKIEKYVRLVTATTTTATIRTSPFLHVPFVRLLVAEMTVSTVSSSSSNFSSTTSNQSSKTCHSPSWPPR